MNKLYPPIDPYDTGFLKVSDVHSVYYEQVGSPSGIPIIFLHGGPGDYVEPKHRQYFNPKKYRIILFDQRGCGKSKPRGEINDNTTQHLLQDIEKLRNHLKIDTWHVFGRSWGSTLALLYAEDFPERVMSLLIGGIFIYTKSEVDWSYYGVRQFIPDAWEKFVSDVPEEKRDNLPEVFYERIMSQDMSVVKRAALAFADYSGNEMKLVPDVIGKLNDDEIDDLINTCRIFFHYESHAGFIVEGQILKNIHKIAHIPIVIIHGRYDIACPIITAWELHKRLPHSILEIVQLAGHSSSEEANIDRIIKYTDSL